MTRVIWVAVAVSVVVAGVGCGRDKVDEAQPAAQFRAAVEGRLTDFEARIARAKKVRSDLPGSQADAMISATEMAEEKIETLRGVSLPKLAEVSGEDLTQIKADINAVLVEIADQIKKAEAAVEKGLPDKAKFARDTREELKALSDQLSKAKKQTKGLGPVAESKATVALESAEEAIQEAGSSLGRYLSAKDGGDKIRANVQDLVKQAKAELAKAQEAIESARKAERRG